MRLIVDASVAVKWFVEEVGFESAWLLADAGFERIAPEFLIAETANVLQRKSRTGELTGEQATTALATLPFFFDRLVPSVELVKEAFNLSRLLDHSVYDCMYLALALQDVGAQLVTSDEKFIGKATIAGFGHRIWNLDVAAHNFAAGQENDNG